MVGVLFFISDFIDIFLRKIITIQKYHKKINIRHSGPWINIFIIGLLACWVVCCLLDCWAIDTVLQISFARGWCMLQIEFTSPLYSKFQINLEAHYSQPSSSSFGNTALTSYTTEFSFLIASKVSDSKVLWPIASMTASYFVSGSLLYDEIPYSCLTSSGLAQWSYISTFRS